MSEFQPIRNASIKASRSRKRVPKFNRPEGVLGIPRIMIRSAAYKQLSAKSVKLMLILQDVYNPSESVVHYSTKRAEEAAQMSHPTVCKAFNELMDKGFIELLDHHDWMNGKAREWRLTWLPFKGKEPTDDWQYWQPEKSSKNRSSGQKSLPVKGKTGKKI